MTDRVCAFDGCDRPVGARGLCRGHYGQAHRGEPLRPLRRLIPGDVCSFPGCSKPHQARGYCVGHAAQDRAGKELKPLRQVNRDRAPECTHSGCDRKHYARGLCQSHYLQLVKGATTTTDLGTSPTYVTADEAVAEMLAAGFTPSVPFVSASTPWPGVCQVCGHEGSPRLVSVRRGQGACAACGGGFSTTRDAWVYVVTDGSIVKVGVSNTPSRRLAVHARQGLDDLRALVKCADGHTALALEDAWLAIVAAHPDAQVTRDRLPDGHTEALAADPVILSMADALVEDAIATGKATSDLALLAPGH